MERLQHLFGFTFGLTLIGLCQGFPIPLTSQDNGSSIDLPTSLIAVVFLVATVSLVFGCVCCRRNKGFQEFNNAPSNTNVAFENPTVAHVERFVDPGGGNRNSSETNEVTLFPPTSITSPAISDHTSLVVRFEPLPEIISPILTEKSAPVTATVLRRPAGAETVSCSDWFEGTSSNFPRQQLHYLRELGRGWFGRAVEGEATGLNEESSNIAPRRVVVKILHEDATAEDQQAFLHEVRPYRDLKHPNVLRLLGRCLDQEPFLVVLESCSSGDLKSFLQQHESSAVALAEQGVTLRMACHVAAGLKHMHDHGFVHTDLAARNCLVGADLTVKIGDYGTSFEAFKNEYYWSGDLAVPVRWCSPESLHYTDTTIEPRTVTPAANIWSLGVVLWEICQMGQLPYSSLSDDEVVVSVLGPSRLRLPCPDLVPEYPQKDYLYRIMQACWRLPEHDRPEVHHIWTILEHLHSTRHTSSTEQETIFEERWAALRPNKLELKETNIENTSICSSPQSSFLSVETTNTEIPPRSASLQNLHGSVEDLINGTCPSTIASSTIDSRETSLSHYESLGDEKVSEAIQQIDDALASERTSSSNSSLSPVLTQRSTAYQQTNTRITSSDSDEDDTWRRIQKGEFTEKVKQKSKSVADLMILTHIETSDTSDSEPPSLSWPGRLDSLRFLDLSMPLSLIKSDGGSFRVKAPFTRTLFDDTLFSSLENQEEESLERFHAITTNLNYNNLENFETINKENEIPTTMTKTENKNTFPTENGESNVEFKIIENNKSLCDFPHANTPLDFKMENFDITLSPSIKSPLENSEKETFFNINMDKIELFPEIAMGNVEEKQIAQMHDRKHDIESKIFEKNTNENIPSSKQEISLEHETDNFSINKINKNNESQNQELAKKIENIMENEFNYDINVDKNESFEFLDSEPRLFEGHKSNAENNSFLTKSISHENRSIPFDINYPEISKETSNNKKLILDINNSEKTNLESENEVYQLEKNISCIKDEHVLELIKPNQSITYLPFETSEENNLCKIISTIDEVPNNLEISSSKLNSKISEENHLHEFKNQKKDNEDILNSDLVKKEFILQDQKSKNEIIPSEIIKNLTKEFVKPIAEDFVNNLISTASSTIYNKQTHHFSFSPDPKELASKLECARIDNEHAISLTVPSLHFTLATPQTSGRTSPDFFPPPILIGTNVEQSDELISDDDEDIISDSITSVTPADELLSPSELASRLPSSSYDPQPAPLLSTPSLSQDSDSYFPDDCEEFEKPLSSEISPNESLKESSNIMKFLFAERILASVLQEAQKELSNFSSKLNIKPEQSIFSLEEREQRPIINKLPISQNETSTNDTSFLSNDQCLEEKQINLLSSNELNETLQLINSNQITNVNSNLKNEHFSSDDFNSIHTLLEADSSNKAPSPDNGFYMMDDTEKSDNRLDIQSKTEDSDKIESIRLLSPLDSFGSKLLSPSTSQESDSIFSSEDNDILKESPPSPSNKISSTDEEAIKVVILLETHEDPVQISTPDDERSSDSGFRDKGSLSESCDADSDAEDVTKPPISPEGIQGLLKFAEPSEDTLNAGDKSSETPASSSLESSVVTEIQPVSSIPAPVSTLLPQVEDETPDVSSATSDHSAAETVNLEDKARSITLENHVFSPELLNFELQRPALSPEEQIDNELVISEFYNPISKQEKEIKATSEIFDVLDKDATCEISFESEDENEDLELEIDRYLDEEEPQSSQAHLKKVEEDREVELRNLEAHLRRCLEEDRSPTSTLEGMFEAAGAGTGTGGWYLHPPNVEEDTSTSSNSENSYVSFSLDEEFVQAIRNELNLKLPCATGGNQQSSLQLQRSSDDETPVDDEMPDLEDRADLLIQYNVFPGALSPILEERESLSSISDLMTKSSESEPPSPVSGDLLVVDTLTNTATLVTENILQSPPSPTIPPPPPLPTVTYTPDSLSPTLQSPSGEEYLTPEHAGSSGPAAIISSGGSSEMYSCHTSPTSPENVPSEPDESLDTEIPIRPITLLESDLVKVEKNTSEVPTEEINSSEDILSKQNELDNVNSELQEKTQEILTILDKATEGVRLSKHPDRLELVYSLSHGPDVLIDNEPPVSNECSTNWSTARTNKAPMPSPEDESRKLLTDIRLITTSTNNSNQMEDDEMSTSFSHRDEFIQEWDSESHSSADGESSSSGEFIWKDGDHEASVKALKPSALADTELDAVVLEEDDDDQSAYDVMPEFPMASIAEEDEDDCGEDESDSEGSAEFVPSAWNSEATPNRSALRSPDKKSDEDDSETKKNVSFKRQRYHCVYEYPREATSDSEEDIPDEWPSSDIIFEPYVISTPPAISISDNERRYQHESIIAAGLDIKSFADWELSEGDVGEGEADTDTDGDLSEGGISGTQAEPLDFYRLSDFTEGLDDSEFFISSSSKPFAFGIHASEFFPGRGGAASPECLEAIFGDSDLSSSQLQGSNTTNLGELRHTRDKLKLNLGSPALETNNITSLNLESSNNKTESKSKERGEASLLDSGEETEDSGIESSNGRINGAETVAAEVTSANTTNP